MADHNCQTVDKVAALASFEDIKANDFNLNIPRYISNEARGGRRT